MKNLSAYPNEQESLGYFRIFATPPGGIAPGIAPETTEITVFRGAPVKISSVATQDPFTEATAQLTLPQVTVFDTPGEGDVNWLMPNTNIDIVFENSGGYDYDWRWEGYIASYSFSLDGSSSSFSLDLKGALYGLDDYIAIPTFPKQPVPYEILIAQAFDQDEHPASLGKFQVLFPSDWADDQRHLVPDYKDKTYYQSALKPWGVATGQKWTGLTTRNTGSWEAVLTGYVQTMLSNMFDEGGRQWSIRNLGHRRPQLFLRRIPDTADDRIIEINLGAPGVSMDGTRDFTQSVGVLYGVGNDFAGVHFSNIQVSPDGKTTHFAPFAYSPRMWPRKNNPNYDPRLKPIERQLRFQDGVDELSAITIAQAQYTRFAEPGITGSITLTTDPRLSSGALMPRLMIKAGQTIRINGLLGVREGVLAHLTEVQADFDGLTTQLTYDTKYRDQLTVAEVKARTHDSLSVNRALQVGKFTNTIQDLVLPWSYSAGSGIIPQPATEFFNEKLSQHPNATFPFEEFTTQWPPNNPASKDWYIKIGPTNKDNSNRNWSGETRNGVVTSAIPIRMSQAGTIRLSQLAAYDKTGHVMKVKFHLSVYSDNGVAAKSMPQFPAARQKANGDPNPDFPPYLDARAKGIAGTADSARPVIPTTYTQRDSDGMSQTHPFYKGAWEKVAPDGTEDKADWTQAAGSLVVGWGTYFEPAGYFPGSRPTGANRTGLFSDDTQWSWNLTGDTVSVVDPNSNVKSEWAGILFVMIYCDDQGDEPVYFMGRFIRVDPGQQ